MKIHLTVAAAVLAALAAPAFADETTFCNVFITSLPFTITSQGHYCFSRNLSTAITTGAAITVDSDFVVLDLNNFKLGGGGAGLATDMFGIYANNHSNITIRGGNIRGFAVGIAIEGTTGSSAQSILIENNVLDGNTKVGINVFGKAITIRNNTVYNTGGSTSPNLFCDAGNTVGIAVSFTSSCVPLHLEGPVEVVGNTVINTFAPMAGGANIAGIVLVTLNKSVVYLNRVMQVTGGVTRTGIVAENGVCRDNTVTDATAGYACAVMVGTNSAN
jgi:parallel beta-helix repeat protein